jgi:penicillin-insensitive murein endopeptidase
MAYCVVRGAWRAIAVIGLTLGAPACARAPSPLVPIYTGSIGVPHHGVLTEAAELPRESEGLRWLRNDDRHWALPRFATAIERAAGRVAHARPGSPPLYVGDLSKRTGGALMPHLSHRTGRDADLLLYATTLDGVPVASPGFVHFEADGLAWDPVHGRFLRFDVEREWLLVKALVEDDEARIQWIFANSVIEALVIEWARARGEPTETVFRAMSVMLEPKPGGAHDDHVHVRTACTLDEIAHGCEPTGPARDWMDAPAADPADDERETSDEELAIELLRPLDTPASLSMAP